MAKVKLMKERFVNKQLVDIWGETKGWKRNYRMRNWLKGTRGRGTDEGQRWENEQPMAKGFEVNPQVYSLPLS